MPNRREAIDHACDQGRIAQITSPTSSKLTALVMVRHSGAWARLSSPPDLGLRVNDRHGIIRAVGDGVGHSKQLDPAAFVDDTPRDRPVQDEPSPLAQRRIAHDHAMKRNVFLDRERAFDILMNRAHYANL
jgi:hypothetical protein